MFRSLPICLVIYFFFLCSSLLFLVFILFCMHNHIVKDNDKFFNFQVRWGCSSMAEHAWGPRSNPQCYKQEYNPTLNLQVVFQLWPPVPWFLQAELWLWPHKDAASRCCWASIHQFRVLIFASQASWFISKQSLLSSVLWLPRIFK